MNIYKLILRRRTIRKFLQKKVAKAILLDCINAARLAPSAANLQPLEYILISKNLSDVFGCLRWAAYLENGAPGSGERPAAYVAIVSNKKINPDAKYDAGLSAENIILTAMERKIASCIIGSIDRNKLAKILRLPKNYVIELVIALGYAKQESREEKFKGDIKYWLDARGVLHVPKRRLGEIAHKETF